MGVGTSGKQAETSRPHPTPTVTEIFECAIVVHQLQVAAARTATRHGVRNAAAVAAPRPSSAAMGGGSSRAGRHEPQLFLQLG